MLVSQIILLIYMSFLNLFTGSDAVINFKLNTNSALPQAGLHDRLDLSAFRKVPPSEPCLSPHNLKPQNQPSFDKIMEERQRLINQYLQLNIQLLQKEIQQKEKLVEVPQAKDKQEPPREDQSKSQIDSLKKKIKKINNCGHEDRPHYAKGFCTNCYQRYGRVKKPWRCSHEKLYAAGMCQNCYINDYNRKRREEASRNEDIKQVSSDLSQMKPKSQKQMSLFEHLQKKEQGKEKESL